ncbi:hypothetical protein AB0M02_18825 [Actinoplanes sp. NPDC051861]|uniref:hypothetical protein n=1 Tax=Actinoplanes sp. NPDC051861 TaxID=3155170 RepID=UPI003418CEA8
MNSTDHEGGDMTEDSRSRRRLVLIGAGGAAGLLVGGVLFATQMRDPQQERLPEVVVAAPLDTTAAADPEPASDAEEPAAGTTAPDNAAPKTADTVDRTTEPPQPRTTERVRDEIEQARARAAEEGVTLQRPLKQARGAQVEHRTETTKNGTIRVTTARDDLTGTAPLTIAADEGTRVGSAHCTDRVRFSQDAPAVKRPTLLLCWRTSADRSVVTMAVTPKGKPKAATSVEIIDQEWAKLG